MALAQISVLFLHSILFTGLLNPGITLVSAKACKAFWLTLADQAKGVSPGSGCPYSLQSGVEDDIPATWDSGAILFHGEFSDCYYVEKDDRCTQTGHDSFFQEYADGNDQPHGIFCVTKSTTTAPENLPKNAFPELDRQVYWTRNRHRRCAVSYVDTPCLAYWLKLADETTGFILPTMNCPYSLQSGSGSQIPATQNPGSGEIQYNGDYAGCYYVPNDIRCPQTGDKSFFQEKVDGSRQLRGIFCLTKSKQMAPEFLPPNAYPKLGRQVHWNFDHNRICRVSYTDIPPRPAYWLEFGPKSELVDESCPFVLISQSGLRLDPGRYDSGGYSEWFYHTPWDFTIYDTCYFITSSAAPNAISNCPNSGQFDDDFFQVKVPDVSEDVGVFCQKKNDVRDQPAHASTKYKPFWTFDEVTGSWSFMVSTRSWEDKYNGTYNFNWRLSGP